MKYISTRRKDETVSSAQAIAQGISREGGLFVPEALPKLSLAEIQEMAHMRYQDRACRILSLFLSDFSPEEIRACVEGAYGEESVPTDKFGGNPAPVAKLCPDTYMLELWHGPTCAFKDMALQLLPRLMAAAVSKVMPGKKVCILTATSGDTGKAALEGFRDVPGTQIMVFYPQHGVSEMQKLQMTSQEGKNLSVCAVEGNFDDAQTGVKRLFTDPALRERLAEKGMVFSSANSINWGRLVPQIVYYFSVYCDLLADGEIALGELINITVPTGNFGNILAAYYAKEMGLPIHRLICASNRNNVLSDFIQTGIYNKKRPFHATSSPSMDILVSSNLERLLFALSGGDDSLTADLMDRLAREGEYQIPAEMKKKLDQCFSAVWCDDAQAAQEIGRLFESFSYLCDPHTAVASFACRKYREETGDLTKNVVVSTASPYKFPSSVLSAAAGKREEASSAEEEFTLAQRLEQLSGVPQPQPLLQLRKMPARFAGCCSKEDMEQAVSAFLGL